jgi:hypothetical protein
LLALGGSAVDRGSEVALADVGVTIERVLFAMPTVPNALPLVPKPA